MTSSQAPQLIFGCGGVGHEFVGEEAVRELLHTLRDAGVTRLDTAALYPPTAIGASQRLIGKTGAVRMGFTIDTKVMVSIHGLRGTLEPEKIAESVVGSYEALQLSGHEQINILYAHAPDDATPLRDQAAGFDAQYKKGMFKKVCTRFCPTPNRSTELRVCINCSSRNNEAGSMQFLSRHAHRVHRHLRTRGLRQT